jgi:tripartite-type tricarboxylate transporter receptor subunit TctC
MKRILACVLTAVLAVAGGGASAAETFPSRSVTVVVPFAPGGPTDSAGRIVARGLERVVGQTVVVENVGGAGSTLGAGRVAGSTPDGYTLLLATSSALVIAPHLYRNLRYDTFKSFTPIGMITEAPFILLVNKDAPYKTLAELIAWGKANPGKLNYATPGVGTVQHLSLERIFGATGLTGAHVPFKGSAPTLTALMAGEVDVVIETPNGALPMIQGERLRPLAVTGAKRLPALPDLPTLAEAGVNVEARSWFALLAPAGTPAPALTRLQAALQDALKDEDTVKAMRAAGFEPEPLGPASLEALVAREYDGFARVIKEKNISLGAPG